MAEGCAGTGTRVSLFLLFSMSLANRVTTLGVERMNSGLWDKIGPTNWCSRSVIWRIGACGNGLLGCCVYRASLLASDREYRHPLGGEVPGRRQGTWPYEGLPATSELRLLLDSWNQSVHCPTIEEDIGPENWEGGVWPNCLCSGFPVCWSQGEAFATAAPWQDWGTRTENHSSQTRKPCKAWLQTGQVRYRLKTFHLSVLHSRALLVRRLMTDSISPSWVMKVLQHKKEREVGDEGATSPSVTIVNLLGSHPGLISISWWVLGWHTLDQIMVVHTRTQVGLAGGLVSRYQSKRHNVY